MLPQLASGALGAIPSAAAALQRLLPVVQQAAAAAGAAAGQQHHPHSAAIRRPCFLRHGVPSQPAPAQPWEAMRSYVQTARQPQPDGGASSESGDEAGASGGADSSSCSGARSSDAPPPPPPLGGDLSAASQPPQPRAPLRDACPVPILRHRLRPAAAVEEVFGQIHSTESFSTVDGPGVRFIVFLQGCAMRCSFCSNPDTWALQGGELASSKDIAKQIRRVLPYLKSSHGGLTCSGGEPLLQPRFVAALFREAHAMGLTTTLDTTGQGTKHRNWDVVLPHTDGVLFCIKSLDPDKYASMTGLKQLGALRFAAELAERGIPFWARYVLIPGHTDSPRDIELFVDWALQQPTMAGVELLPYHLYGRNKWRALGLDYPLEGVAPPPPGDVARVVGRLRDAGLRVLCEGAGGARDLSAAHTGAHS